MNVVELRCDNFSTTVVEQAEVIGAALNDRQFFNIYRPKYRHCEWHVVKHDNGYYLQPVLWATEPANFPGHPGLMNSDVLNGVYLGETEQDRDRTIAKLKEKGQAIIDTL
jgi:hypothetical protein